MHSHFLKQKGPPQEIWIIGLKRKMTGYKEVSLNALHSNMGITDQFYSNLNDGEVRNRIGNLNRADQSLDIDQELLEKFKVFLIWRGKNRKQSG